LERTPKKHNILIGDDKMQIRWAQQFLSIAHNTKIEAEVVEIVNDDMVHSEQPRLYVVERSSFIDLAPNIKARVGIWSLDLIEPDSAGLNAIARQGARLMGIEKPDKAQVERIAKEMDEVYDIRAAIWQAAWLWSGSPKEKFKTWLRPWENWMAWMPKGEDPYYRLNALYQELVQWVFAMTGDERGYRKFARNWDPKRWSNLARLQLPKDKVFNTLVVLSHWRRNKYDPYICIMKVAKIWETQ
jgi:hypothetical protein